MRRVPKIVWSVLACLVCIVITAAACMVRFSRGNSSDKYLEVLQIIQDHFYEERDVSGISDASAKAMVASLEDPSSFYMTREEYEEYKLAMTNQYVGIGITTEYNEKYGFLTVTTVTPGSPADLVHIRVGHMISAIDGTNVANFTPEELQALIHSYSEKEKEADQYFTIHLLNSQGGKSEARMKCELIYEAPVYHNVIEDTRIGYVQIVNFDDSAAVSLKAAVEDLKTVGATSLILDVRGNSTGKPAELGDALDFLLPKGDLFLLRDRSGRETTYSSDKNCVQMPMVVIADENTTCAAEMFTCVMQQAGVTIVGRRTPGTALSQTTVEMEDGSAVRISRYEYLTPDKKSMSDLNGVTPDIPSYMIEDSSMDVQLEAAKDVLE